MAESDPDKQILGTTITTRQIEAFGRKVTSTANQLIGPISENTSSTYQNAMSDIHRELRRPGLQRSVFSFVQNSPTEAVRAKLSKVEIEHRALTFIPDDLLHTAPQNENLYSLFQGFQATLPESEDTDHKKKHRRHSSRVSKLLEDSHAGSEAPGLAEMKKERDKVSRRLGMLGIRKNMCSTEIIEIDKRIANLSAMRRIVLDRLSEQEDEEVKVERELMDLDVRVDEMRESVDQETSITKLEKAAASEESDPGTSEGGQGAQRGSQTPITSDFNSVAFMSQSIYEQLPSPKSTRRSYRGSRRRSVPVRHEHLEPGTRLRLIPAHNDMITALDFDTPFGTMVTGALDDTVRVWDIHQGRCIGMLEGHRASVRCLQVEESIVATGSIDADIRVWDLSQANCLPPTPNEDSLDGEDRASENEDSLKTGYRVQSTSPKTTSKTMASTPLFTLSAHVSEITALHFHKNTLVSGSADKTLRQWDLVKGRCVQTLDVLWAAAQASTVSNTITATTNRGASANAGKLWQPTTRLPDADADFVGALQCFESAVLACGTADGMVRLWDLRSGQVGRSLVGHTGPVSALQFDDTYLVTGSLDRSIRIWDLRSGSLYDAYAYDYPVTSMMFDARHVAAAAGEPVVKIFDKADGRQWDCGPDSSNPGRSNGEAKEGTCEQSVGSSIVERIRIKDNFLIEGRRNGEIGVWTC